MTLVIAASAAPSGRYADNILVSGLIRRILLAVVLIPNERAERIVIIFKALRHVKYLRQLRLPLRSLRNIRRRYQHEQQFPEQVAALERALLVLHSDRVRAEIVIAGCVVRVRAQDGGVQRARVHALVLQVVGQPLEELLQGQVVLGDEIYEVEHVDAVLGRVHDAVVEVGQHQEQRGAAHLLLEHLEAALLLDEAHQRHAVGLVDARDHSDAHGLQRVVAGLEPLFLEQDEC